MICRLFWYSYSYYAKASSSKVVAELTEHDDVITPLLRGAPCLSLALGPAECRQLRPIHLRPFVWDHFIWDHVHLRPRHLRLVHLRLHSYETFSFATTFIWDHDIWDLLIWDHINLRPYSFETTFIWDHSHLRPHSFETTLIWPHIHLRPHSFETTLIWDHIHLRRHSFCAMLKWSCFDLLCIKFLWSTFHFFAGDLNICKVTIHLKFWKVTSFRVQGWLTLGCKCTHTSNFWILFSFYFIQFLSSKGW